MVILPRLVGPPPHHRALDKLHLPYRMYVFIYNRTFARMRVRRINLISIHIVWKLNVNSFTSKTRHSRLKISIW